MRHLLILILSISSVAVSAAFSLRRGTIARAVSVPGNDGFGGGRNLPPVGQYGYVKNHWDWTIRATTAMADEIAETNHNSIPDREGRRINPREIAAAARKDCTHILICPGFATSTEDYTCEGSLAPNLVGRGGWKDENIHVLPVERSDWLKVWTSGLRDLQFIGALFGRPYCQGMPPDAEPYRWYLKRIARAIRDIDEGVKADFGPNAGAKVILIGHSAGGWLARAAVGFGSEHYMNSTSLKSEIGIDINNVLAIVTLGTPNLSPPDGTPDVTGGALKIVNQRFPGSYFEDKVFYVSAAGGGSWGSNSSFTSQSYGMVAGKEQRDADGDGIVPIGSAHIDGATQINITNIVHAGQLIADGVTQVWYGSDVIIDKWFGEVLESLAYIQDAENIFRDQQVDDVSANEEETQNDLNNVDETEKENDLKWLKETFNLFDTDGGGSITIQDLKSVLQKLGTSVTERELNAMFAAADENNDGEIEFDEFVALMKNKTQESDVEGYFRRRNALRRSSIFDNILSRYVFESLVYSMEQLSFPLHAKVFTQGDESDAIYFVQSGEFECYKEDTGEVVATVAKNGVVGELGVLLGAPRALSLRASSSDAVLYRISRKDIDRFVLQDEGNKAASKLKNEERYDDYFEEKTKYQALRSCPIFTECQDDDIKLIAADMEMVEIPEGGRIIEEGTTGGSMYFVINGSFACYRESNQNVVRICKKADYFGELGAISTRPRQVSVRAMENSTVWELQGKAFLDYYQKVTLGKFGAASWLVALGNSMRAEKWIGRLIPRSVSRRYRTLLFALGDTFNRFNLLDRHFERKHRLGSKIHLSNAFLSVAIPLHFFSRKESAGSVLSRTVMALTFSALIFDNVVCAIGKYVGEGDNLRWLCKFRNVLHGLTIPLLFLPIIEIASICGLFSAGAAKTISGLIAAFALHETFDWLRFDIQKMVLVDNRDSTTPSTRALPGTLWYSSGKVLKNIVPVATLQLFLLIMGSILWRRNVPAGPLMLVSGVSCLLSCSLQRPDVQALGETVMVGLLWKAVALQ